jgi:hypothetical protein
MHACMHALLRERAMAVRGGDSEMRQPSVMEHSSPRRGCAMLSGLGAWTLCRFGAAKAAAPVLPEG